MEPISNLPSLSQDTATSPALGKLGSLTKSARAKQLKTARGILIVVGILTLLVNGFMFANARHEVEEVIQKQISDLRTHGQTADMTSVAEVHNRAVRLCQLIYGATAFLGVVFIALGIMVYAYPVPTTVIGLVLYIAGIAVFGLLNPVSLAQGIIFRIIIIVALAKSIQAAVAYQKA